MNVLQSRGTVLSISRHHAGNGELEPVSGAARIGIAIDTAKAAQRAILENIPATEVAITLGRPYVEQAVRSMFFRSPAVGANPRCFLVLFQIRIQRRQPCNASSRSTALSAQTEKDRLIGQFRQDLSSTRFHLQSLRGRTGQRGTRNWSRPTKRSNRRTRSCRAPTKSLETTKEELQSANEELQTLNDELQQRNNVLTQTGNDLTNLLNSVTFRC